MSMFSPTEDDYTTSSETFDRKSVEQPLRVLTREIGNDIGTKTKNITAPMSRNDMSQSQFSVGYMTSTKKLRSTYEDSFSKSASLDSNELRASMPPRASSDVLPRNARGDFSSTQHDAFTEKTAEHVQPRLTLGFQNDIGTKLSSGVVNLDEMRKARVFAKTSAHVRAQSTSQKAFRAPNRVKREEGGESVVSGMKGFDRYKYDIITGRRELTDRRSAYERYHPEQSYNFVHTLKDQACEIPDGKRLDLVSGKVRNIS
eukprot:165295_1